MLHVDPLQRMTVHQLDTIYASSSTWAKVRNGMAPRKCLSPISPDQFAHHNFSSSPFSDDWIPTMQSSKMRPVGQSLDFLTFRAREPSAVGAAAAAGAHALLLRTNTDEFEFRVPGEFE